MFSNGTNREIPSVQVVTILLARGTNCQIERFSHDLEMKTREQNRIRESDLIGSSNAYKRAWLLVGCQRTIISGTTNQPILRFYLILQHSWPIEQCLFHIGVFFCGITKRPCFDLFIHWLIKEIKNTYRNHFSRS